MTLREWLDKMLRAADDLESAGVALVAKVAPWLAPIPTAVIIQSRTVEHFAWPWWAGLSAAIAVEALGVVTGLTALESWSYNQSKNKSDSAAPLTLPVILVVAYFVAAELLTVGLDVLPKWGRLQAVDWVPAIFPLLTLVGVGVIAVRVDHSRRLRAAEDARQERRQARQEKKAIVTPETTPVTEIPPIVTEIPAPVATIDRLVDIWRNNPMIPVVEAATMAGVTRQTAYKHLARLQADGRVRKNGNGVEVL